MGYSCSPYKYCPVKGDPRSYLEFSKHLTVDLLDFCPSWMNSSNQTEAHIADGTRNLVQMEISEWFHTGSNSPNDERGYNQTIPDPAFKAFRRFMMGYRLQYCCFQNQHTGINHYIIGWWFETWFISPPIYSE